MERLRGKMKNHYVLCGVGRTGRKICEELKKKKVSYVVIERNIKEVNRLEENNIQVIHGEATDDETLIAAGVEKAKVLISAVDSPADNVFITLTAKGLNPDLRVVARAETKDTEKKLYRAGADKVVMPHSIGGRQMALAALNPSVVQFLDFDVLSEKYAVQIEDIKISPDSSLCNSTLQEADLSHRFGLVVIGIIKKDGKLSFNPGSQTLLHEGDDLILFGSEDQLQNLADIASKGIIT